MANFGGATCTALTGAIQATDCIACPAGYYCENYGTITPLICDEGWYCEVTGSVGEVSRRPYDTTNSVGKYCPIGYYCTQGIKTVCGTNYY
jgi:hypothetical protein